MPLDCKVGKFDKATMEEFKDSGIQLEQFPKDIPFVWDDTKSILRLAIETKEHFDSWLSAFSALSASHWIVERTHPSPKRYSFRVDLACHLSTVNHSRFGAECKRTKKVDCPAKLVAKIKLRTIGFTPAMAIQHHEEYVEESAGISALSDSRVNPKSRSVYHMHDQWRNSTHGDFGGKNMFDKKSVFVSGEGSELNVAVVTDLMKRVVTEEGSIEILFVDSTASVDLMGTTLTLFLVPSCAGALPIGVTMTQAQTDEAYLAAVSQLDENLPDQKFGGSSYPATIMTDDCDSLRKALRAIWPKSNLLLCHFHVMQAVWRWLWDAKHQVQQVHRKPLIILFRQMLYSTSIEEANANYASVKRSRIAKKYPGFLSYIKSLHNRQGEWCLAFRRNIITRGHNTNNYSEVTMRIIKDVILHRCKAYNTAQLVEYILNGFSRFIRNKILNIAFGRGKRKNTKELKRLQKLSLEVDTTTLEALGDGLFSVKSTQNDTQYDLDFSTLNCSCAAGIGGRLCKHLFAFKEKELLDNLPENSTRIRHALGVLALGAENTPEPYFFSALIEPNVAVIVGQLLHNPEPKNTETAKNDAQNKVSFQSKDHSSSCQIVETENMDTTTLGDYHNIHNHFEANKENISYQENFLQLISEQLNAFGNDPSVRSGIEKFTRRLKCVKTPNQLSSLLHSVETTRLSNGYKIKCQPTSIARRQPGKPRGSAPLPVGRPRLLKDGEKVTRKRLKRPRNLALNINLNRPNAKSHGSNH